MEWNNIGLMDIGIEFLAESLKLNTTVNSLDLRNNRIGPQGAESIARMLKTNTALTRIDLRWNELSPVGGRSILLAL